MCRHSLQWRGGGKKGCNFLISRGVWMQLNLSLRCRVCTHWCETRRIMHLWVFAQCHTDPLRHIISWWTKPTKRANIITRDHADLVRCLLEEWTSISLLLNSFSSFRIAACGGTKATSSKCKPRCSPSYIDAAAQVLQLKSWCYENGKTSVVSVRIMKA